MMNHHHEWIDDDPQQLDVQATGVVDSGVEDVTGYRRHGGEDSYNGWMQDVANYDGETVDVGGRDEVTVLVGARQTGFLFEPCAVLVDEGTTATWEWTGKGGAHNVQTLSGIEISEIAEDEGHTVSKTMDIMNRPSERRTTPSFRHGRSRRIPHERRVPPSRTNCRALKRSYIRAGRRNRFSSGLRPLVGRSEANGRDAVYFQ